MSFSGIRLGFLVSFFCTSCWLLLFFIYMPRPLFRLMASLQEIGSFKKAVPSLLFEFWLFSDGDEFLLSCSDFFTRPSYTWFWSWVDLDVNFRSCNINAPVLWPSVVFCIFELDKGGWPIESGDSCDFGNCGGSCYFWWIFWKTIYFLLSGTGVAETHLLSYVISSYQELAGGDF